MLAIMINYAIVWFPDASNPRLNEMAIGFTIGAFYGWPTWFILPVLALVDRKTAPAWRTFLFSIPSVIAFSMYGAGVYLAGWKASVMFLALHSNYAFKRTAGREFGVFWKHIGPRPLNAALGSDVEVPAHMKVLYSGPVAVCYGQIYAVSPGCDPVLLESAFVGQTNGLCGAQVHGGLMLLCGLHTGRVHLEVIAHETEPPLEASWTDVVEAPFQFISSPVSLEDWNGHPICRLPIEGAGFMVRWSARRFGEAEETGHADDEEPFEEYSLSIWESASLRERVVRSSGEKADYWHHHAKSL